MSKFKTITATAALVALVGCGAGEESAGSAALDTDDQKASYGIGMNMGTQLEPASERLDMAAFRRGLEDGLAGREAVLPQQEIQRVLQQFAQEIQEAQQAEREEQAAESLRAGEEFLAENAEREGVITTPSGLQYTVLEEGDGATPGEGDQVRIHYTGTLLDGTEFDTSRDGEPATFAVGSVIPGFSEALQLMPEGSRFKIWIPSDLAYGEQGTQGLIGPNATLVFDLELLEVMEGTEGEAGSAGG